MFVSVMELGVLVTMTSLRPRKFEKPLTVWVVAPVPSPWKLTAMSDGVPAAFSSRKASPKPRLLGMLMFILPLVTWA